VAGYSLVLSGPGAAATEIPLARPELLLFCVGRHRPASARIGPIIAALDPPKPTGRPHIDARRALEAILFWVRNRCRDDELRLARPRERTLPAP
jgi:hypothetical protein